MSTYMNVSGVWREEKNIKRRAASLIIGTSTAGHTEDEVDILCTGSSDHVTINNGITGKTGITIKMLSGTYKIGGTITLPQGTSLEGEGWGTILEVAGVNNAKAAIASENNSVHIRVADLAIKQTDTIYNTRGIDIQENITIENIYTEKLGIPVYPMKNCLVTGCKFKNFNNKIYMGHNKVVFTNNYVESDELTYVNAVTSTENKASLIVTNNIFKGRSTNAMIGGSLVCNNIIEVENNLNSVAVELLAGGTAIGNKIYMSLSGTSNSGFRVDGNLILDSSHIEVPLIAYNTIWASKVYATSYAYKYHVMNNILNGELVAEGQFNT